MTVKKLSINNWRNYDTASLNLSSGINVIIGDNAQGKTNLLEALYVCGVGRSARTPRDKEIIKWNQSQASANVLLAKRLYESTVDIIIDSKVNKRIAVNGIPLTKIGDLMGECSCVLFSPDEMKIIKDSPSERRKFVDIALCQISKAYFYALSDFTKVLAQRNKLLKIGQNDRDSIDIWDIQLSNIGAKIIKNRRGYVKELEGLAQDRHSYLTDDKEKLSLEYEGIDGSDLEDIKSKFLSLLSQNRQLDIKHGYTHIGPHKDDICIKIDGIDVRSYGSQGQQRTASLSLKLAEVDMLNKNSGEYPILLLDDVLSELDANRCIKLLKSITNVQTIITATHIEPALAPHLEAAKVFVINDGKIVSSQVI